MFPYWAIFAIFAIAAATEATRRPENHRGWIGPLAAALLLTFFIGLRYQVGGDWFEYLDEFRMAGYQSFFDTIVSPDPGYEILNWMGQQLGVEIWFVNLACAAVFVWGLLKLAFTQPRPWLVVLLSIPYLMTVVAMGYTRQGVAIGLIMASTAVLVRGGSMVWAVAYVALATLFHKTALIMLPALAIATGQSAIWNMAAIVPAAYGLYVTFLAPSMGHLVAGYIGDRYSSGGAGIRIAMLLIPATVFLIMRNRLGFTGRERLLWLVQSVMAFACLGLLLYLPSSTAVDRLGLYLLPLQIVVLARLPATFLSEGSGRALLITYAAAVLFVWLTQGTFSRTWLPYRNYISEAVNGTA